MLAVSMMPSRRTVKTSMEEISKSTSPQVEEEVVVAAVVAVEVSAVVEEAEEVAVAAVVAEIVGKKGEGSLSLGRKR